MLAALAFAIAATLQAINGPDLDKAAAWPFWLFVGLCLWCIEGPARTYIGSRR
jgi:cell shape-determining protein MreD